MINLVDHAEIDMDALEFIVTAKTHTKISTINSEVVSEGLDFIHMKVSVSRFHKEFLFQTRFIFLIIDAARKQLLREDKCAFISFDLYC